MTTIASFPLVPLHLVYLLKEEDPSSFPVVCTQGLLLPKCSRQPVEVSLLTHNLYHCGPDGPCSSGQQESPSSLRTVATQGVHINIMLNCPQRAYVPSTTSKGDRTWTDRYA